MQQSCENHPEKPSPSQGKGLKERGITDEVASVDVLAKLEES
jgi:hypothetical protein